MVNLMRLFAETLWYPTALLPSQGIHWEVVDTDFLEWLNGRLMAGPIRYPCRSTRRPIPVVYCSSLNVSDAIHASEIIRYTFCAERIILPFFIDKKTVFVSP
jgi:hypothetical protein